MNRNRIVEKTFYLFIDATFTEHQHCSPKDLVKTFGLSRQKASSAFNAYRLSNPVGISYDTIAKTYISNSEFTSLYDWSDDQTASDFLYIHTRLHSYIHQKKEQKKKGPPLAG